MDTIVKTGFATTKVEKTKAKTQTQSAFWEEAEYSRYGLSPMILLVLVCVGGIAAATMGSNIPQLFLVSLATTLSLTTIIAVMPMKQVVIFSIVTLIIDIIFILVNGIPS